MFTLKSGTGNNAPKKRGLASKEEIERQETIGNTHLVFEDRSYFIYINDDSEREAFKHMIGLPNYEWFQEGTGKKNWVLYNPIQFKPDKNWNGKKILKFNKDDYAGGRFELPINASSCCGMFSWCTLPENFILGRQFETKNVVDMNLMFAGSVLPGSFRLSEKFETKNVLDMRYMFYECVLPDNFEFNQSFDTSKVEMMDFMFSECNIPKDLKLPETFDTSKAKSMDHMFYETIFRGNFNFGEKFIIGADTKKDMLFTECIINEEMIDAKYGEDFDYVKNLLSEQAAN
jgi:hypothetical protein